MEATIHYAHSRQTKGPLQNRRIRQCIVILINIQQEKQEHVHGDSRQHSMRTSSRPGL